MEQPNGCVKFFNTQKGYGFITITEGDDKDQEVFCHFSSIESQNQSHGYGDKKNLAEGQTVYVEYQMEPKGLKASKVKLIPPDQPGAADDGYGRQGGGGYGRQGGGGGYGRQGGGYQDYNRGYGGDRGYGGYQDRGYGGGGGYQQRY